jgi:small subunit ribosomal protein S21
MRKPNKSGKGLCVEVKDDNLNVALRKFKKKVDESNKLVDIVKSQHFEKPTTERKRKKGAARSRWLKKLRDESLPKKQF